MVLLMSRPTFSFFFFFNDTATTEIYTLSLHDALPICWPILPGMAKSAALERSMSEMTSRSTDRKSTRLNSSHSQISYAVFCLKKKKNKKQNPRQSKNYIQHPITVSQETQSVTRCNDLS